LEKVPAKYDDRQTTKFSILKSSKVPQLLVDLIKGVEAKHANLVDDQEFPAPPPLLTLFIAYLVYVILHPAVENTTKNLHLHSYMSSRVLPCLPLPSLKLPFHPKKFNVPGPPLSAVSTTPIYDSPETNSNCKKSHTNGHKETRG
jgi:hypothetical protein